MDRPTELAESAPEPRRGPTPTRPEIQLGVLDDYIGFHLRQAQNAAFRAFKRRTGDPDVRPGWFSVLALIGANPGITPAFLSRASGRDKSTLTPILRDLTHQRLIRRMPVAGDKRSYALALTGAGDEKLAVLSAHAALHEHKLDAIAGARKVELLKVLRRITALLD
jgi:DNA-binding MarR family transcriptional regulator